VDKIKIKVNYHNTITISSKVKNCKEPLKRTNVGTIGVSRQTVSDVNDTAAETVLF